MSEAEIFGARASVRIRYAGTLRELAARLAKGLILPDLTVERSEYPPHEDIASAEALGWEVWLNAEEDSTGGSFILSMATEHSLMEQSRGNMHDLSPWLARYVRDICDLKTIPD